MEKLEPFPAWTVEVYIAVFGVWFSIDSLFSWNGHRRCSRKSSVFAGQEAVFMVQPLARPVADLIEAFSRLPGVGPKTASRLTFYLLREPQEVALALADALAALADQTVLCELCFNVTEASPCPICADPGRDQRVICIVEEPLDVLAVDRTGAFAGVYHVLHGALSPIDGVFPEQLRIAELMTRVRATPPDEVILATNPSLEGENTAAYIHQQLMRDDIKVTRLARGLPIGGDLEYTDEVTLARALEGRRSM
jgi:recombination protein RecR